MYSSVIDFRYANISVSCKDVQGCPWRLPWPCSTRKQSYICLSEHQSLCVTPFCQVLHRRHIAETLIVVITVPLLGYPFHFLYASEDVRVKYSPSVTAIESFYVSVLGRTFRLGIQTNIVPFAPFPEILWNELRVVIVSDIFQLAVQPDYLFQCLYHPSCRERHRNFLGYRHLIAVIHYVQHQKLSSALQDITLKIQRTCRIGLPSLLLLPL